LKKYLDKYILDALQLCCTAFLASLSPVCRLSVVCNECIAAKRYFLGETFLHEKLAMCLKPIGMQNFSQLVQGKHFPIEVGKMCVFLRKTGHISKTVRDRVKVTINY